MAEILPDALKENKCEGLLRLIAGLADGAGRPKSERIIRLADAKGDRKKAGEMRVTPLFFRSPRGNKCLRNQTGQGNGCRLVIERVWNQVRVQLTLDSAVTHPFSLF